MGLAGFTSAAGSIALIGAALWLKIDPGKGFHVRPDKW